MKILQLETSSNDKQLFFDSILTAGRPRFPSSTVVLSTMMRILSSAGVSKGNFSCDVPKKVYLRDEHVTQLDKTMNQPLTWLGEMLIDSSHSLSFPFSKRHLWWKSASYLVPSNNPQIPPWQLTPFKRHLKKTYFSICSKLWKSCPNLLGQVKNYQGRNQSLSRLKQLSWVPQLCHG